MKIEVDSAGIFTNYTFAQGNQDTDAVTAGTADISGDGTVILSTSVVNTYSASTSAVATEVINLPTIGDVSGSQINFQLSGPISLPANYTTANGVGDPLTATVLYSTSLATLSESDESADTTGYVTADEVTDWGAIRSIIIELTGMATNTTTGRITMTGTIENFKDMAGYTGYLQTAMFASGSTASIQNQNTTPKAASISVVGTATVGARFHYVDVDGNEQYIELPDLTQSVAINSGTLENIYPTTLAGFSAADLALIPAGYALVTNADGTISYTVVDSNGDGAAVVGAIARTYFDGDQIQYDLVGKQLNLEYVDDDNGGAQVGATKVYEGNASDTVNWTTTIPTGYALASGQAASGTYTLGDKAVTTLQIHLVHLTTTISASNTFSAQVIDQNGTTLDAATGTSTYEAIKDEVTEAETTVTSVMPSVSVTIPAGYTLNTITMVIVGSAPQILDADDLAAYEAAGYITVDGSTYSLNMAALIGGESSTAEQIAKAIGQLDGTELTLNVTADPQSTTVTFVDADNGDTPIGSAITVNGVTGGTSTYEVGNKIPAGYYYTTTLTDAAGDAITNPALTGSIAFTSDGAAGLTIYLKHKLTVGTATSSRTITYVIDNHDGTPASDQSKAPATVTQTIVWKTITDQVTGMSYATPQGVYAAVNSDPVTGYTVDTPIVALLAQNGMATSAVTDATPVVVHYTPDEQTTTLRFVDLDEGDTQIGESQTITGYTDATTPYAVSGALPTGYYYPATIGTDDDGNPLNNTPLSGDVSFSSDGAAVVTIYLKHILTESTATTTRTITYQINDAPNHVSTDQSKAPAPVVQTITWKIVTDEVTGTSYATAQEAYAAVTSPTLPGYSVDTTVVPVLAQGSVSTDALANAENVLVQYTADAQAMTVTVVDADEGNHVLNSETLTGYTDSTVSYDYRDLQPGYFHPATYGGEPNAPLTMAITFSATDAANVTIYLQHIITNSTMTTTRTINYEIDTADGSRATDQSKAPAQVVQTITWKVVTDEATGTSYATAQDAYATVTSPTVTGYTPTPASVDMLPQGNIPTADVKNAGDVLVKYAPNKQNTTIVFIDADAAGEDVQIGEAIPVNGYSDASTPYDVTDKVPAGYYYPATIDGAANTPLTGDADFSSTGADPIKIYLKHIITTGTITTTRTINYQIDNADGTRATDQTLAPGQVVQTITWQTVTDQVTGTSYATAQQAYAAVTSPAVAGYTADPLSVTVLPQGSVATAEVKNAANVLVEYKPNVQTTQVILKDADAGDTVLGTVSVSGVTNASTDYDVTGSVPANYYWSATANPDAGTNPGLKGSINFTADGATPLTIYLKHIIADSTMTTTRTINYELDDSAGNALGDQSKAPAQAVQTITWQIVTDKVTGTSYATAQEAYAALTSPTVAGYSPDQPTVAVLAQGSLPTADVKNAADVLVKYAPKTQDTTIVFLDLDTHNAQVGEAIPVSGFTDESTNYNVANQIPTNYYYPADTAENTPNTPLIGEVSFTSDGAPVVQIYVKHIITNSTMTTTRTINYQIDNGEGTRATDQSKAPASVTQQITWKIVTDKVTGTSVATAQQAYAAVTSPPIAGYTVAPTTVAVLPQGSVATADVKNADDVLVEYTPVANAVTVTVVDADEGDRVLNDVTLTGYTDSTTSYDFSSLPANYYYPATDGTDEAGQPVANAPLAQSITFGSTPTAPLTIYLKHKLSNSTMTTTRTITYQINDVTGHASSDQSKAPTPVVQTITWNVVKDNVTETSYATAQDAYAAVTSDTIPGYTVSDTVVPVLPQGSLATSDVKNAPTVTVVYTPQPQATAVTLVDADGGYQVLSTTAVAGVTDETVGYDVRGQVPVNYYVPTTVKDATGQTVNNPALKADITLTSDGAVAITIYLKHVLTSSTMTTTRTINYQIDDVTGALSDDQSKAPAPVVQQITWKVITDNVTKSSYATAQDAYAAVKSPTVNGYTVDPETVAVLPQGSVKTSDVKNATPVTVVYTPIANTTQVRLVDFDEGDKVLSTTDVNGATDATVPYDVSDAVPTGYTYPATVTDAAGETIINPALKGSISFTSDGAPVVTIYLKHMISNSTLTTTRTINYQLNDATGQAATDQSKAPAQVVQPITWKVVTDEVTGTSYATAQQAYAAVTSKSVAGYTVDTAVVPVLAQGNLATSAVQNAEPVTVIYTPIAQETTVRLVDADDGDRVLNTTDVAGVTDETVGYDVSDQVPAQYEVPTTVKTAAGTVITNPALKSEITFGPNGAAVVTIYLKHVITNSTLTTTRTINYQIDNADGTVAASQSKAPTQVVQSINWQVVTDEVTGTSYATAQQAYAAVKSPTIAGYTADPSTIAVLAQGSIATSAVQNAADVLVQYHPDKQVTTVSFVDADDGDAPIGTVTTVDGYTDGTTGYDVSGKIPAGYYYPATYDTVAQPDLTSKTTTGGMVNAPLQGVIAFTSNGAAGIVIHLKHLLVDSTVTTTRTIHAVAGTGVDASTLPADIVQTVTWQVVTDEATGQVLATPQSGYAAQTLRPISLGAGQTLVPSQYSVDAETLQQATTMASLMNSTVNVTYGLAQLPDNGSPAAYKVSFVDATGHVVGTATLTGQTGQVFTLTAPNGYQYAKNVSGTVTLNGDSSQIIELLVVKTGGETNPSNPTNPTNPTKPDNGGQGGQNGGTGKGSGEIGRGIGNGSVVNTATGTREQNPSTNALLDQHTHLPQTGDTQNNALSVIGLSLMGMLAMLGIGAKKRKKDDTN